jgi:uncharacterized membrane protein
MIIMALDHVRDMIHVNSITQSPTNLATTTPTLFFTRWITYLCAPTFVFLAGTSVYISLLKKKDVLQSSRFLLKRGLYLILLEFVVVNFGLFFDPGFHTLIFEVIATIGVGFIVLSLLLKFPVKTVAFIGIAILLFHNLFVLIPFKEGSTLKTIASLFFMPGAIPFLSQHVFIMGYPPIPWLGIMLLGYATGHFFEWTAEKRRDLFLKAGSGAILLFGIIRYLNVYGDLVPRAVQKSGTLTFLSFMNVTKYPPSLQFCLITLGIMLLLLSYSELRKNRITTVLSVYGKVPMFYFIIHFFMIHVILLVVLLLQGFHWSDLDFASGTFGRPKGAESGLPLWSIYLIWMGVVGLLYPPCKWFGKYKATHYQWWLKYI